MGQIWGRHLIGRALLAAGVAIGAGLLAAGGASAQEAACAGLTGASFPKTTQVASKMVAANAQANTPAYCEVTATVASEPGSRIGVVYRLPASWNGKLIGFGGGGWAGNVAIGTATAALNKGYATAQTDGGHPSLSGADTSWVAPGGKPAEIALKDFSHRGVHEMTVLGKLLVARHYGRPQSRAYFQGCSTGGRMALMEAQRYPGDYDGIIAGAPVNTLRVQGGEIWRDLIFTAPGAALSAPEAAMVHKASLAACDDLDGLKDGIVADPRACRFDPATLQCRAGATTDCLRPAQVEAIRKAYTEVRNASGGGVAIFPLNRGHENAWPQFINTTNNTTGPPARNLGLRAPMFGDPDFPFAKFDPARDMPKSRSLWFAKEYEAADPDLSPYINRGGKLLLWHGVDDPLPSYLGTVEYYGNVQRVTGAKVGSAALDGSVRLFLAPGVYHCGNGPGANQFDLIDVIDNWVEKRAAPATIAANRTDGSMPRPLCPYPALPRYVGTGDVRDMRSFACRRP